MSIAMMIGAVMQTAVLASVAGLVQVRCRRIVRSLWCAVILPQKIAGAQRGWCRIRRHFGRRLIRHQSTT